MPSTNPNDRLREIAREAGIGFQHQAAAAPTRRAQVTVAPEVTVKVVAAAPEKQVVVTVDNNVFARNMAVTNRSTGELIESNVRQLLTKDGQYEVSRKAFADFEAYIAHAQGERMEIGDKAIQRLIDELKSSQNSEIAEIVQNIMKVQQGSERVRDLLAVMRTARLNNTTIKDIADAMVLNDRVLAEIDTLTKNLEGYRDTEKDRQTTYDAQLDKRTASQQGFWNMAARLVTGPDKNVSALIDAALGSLNETKENIRTTQEDLNRKQEERRTDLEDGSLKILRTIDKTERGITAAITENAESSLALIASTRNSIRVLLDTTAKSEAAGRDIFEKIRDAKKRDGVLKGTIQQVVTAEHDGADALKAQLDALDADIAKYKEGDTEYTVLKSDRIGLNDKYDAALRYEQDVKKLETVFVKIDADSVEAENLAHQLFGLVTATKELLSEMFNEALPATQRGLQMGLEQARAMQTAELAHNVAATLKRARQGNEKNLEGLTTAENELDQAEIDRLNDAITAIDHAEAATTERLKIMIDQGLAKQGAVGKLVESADKLNLVMGRFQEAAAIVASRPEQAQADYAAEDAATEAPATPAGAVSSGSAHVPGDPAVGPPG